MISLAEITRYARVALKYGVVAAGVLTLLFLLFLLIRFLINVINPPVPEPPGMKFGPMVNNLPVQTTRPTHTYNINTITGLLPVVPDRLRVYKVKQPESDLLALQKAREVVRTHGYTLEETLVSPGEYRWKNSTGGSIIYDIQSKNFQLVTGIGLEKQDFVLPSEDNITSQLLTYIQDFGSSLIGLDQQTPLLEYYQSDGTNLLPVVDRTTAYLAKVTFKQNDLPVDPFIFKTDESRTVESLPLYYTQPDGTNQTFIVKAGGRNIQIVSGTFKNYQIDTADFSTYPLKTPEQAFEDLKNGDAYFVNPGTTNTISITEVVLGYFMPETTPEYVMPIYIFKGKDFTAYVYGIGTYVPDQNLSN